MYDYRTGDIICVPGGEVIAERLPAPWGVPMTGVAPEGGLFTAPSEELVSAAEAVAELEPIVRAVFREVLDACRITSARGRPEFSRLVSGLSRARRVLDAHRTAVRIVARSRGVPDGLLRSLVLWWAMYNADELLSRMRGRLRAVATLYGARPPSMEMVLTRDWEVFRQEALNVLHALVPGLPASGLLGEVEAVAARARTGLRGEPHRALALASALVVLYAHKIYPPWPRVVTAIRELTSWNYPRSPAKLRQRFETTLKQAAIFTAGELALTGLKSGLARSLLVSLGVQPYDDAWKLVDELAEKIDTGDVIVDAHVIAASALELAGRRDLARRISTPELGVSQRTVNATKTIYVTSTL